MSNKVRRVGAEMWSTVASIRHALAMSTVAGLARAALMQISDQGPSGAEIRSARKQVT
jgi:hypothetical protein